MATNWPLITLIIVGAGVAGYFLYQRSEKDKLIQMSKLQTWAEGGGTLGGEIHNAIVGGGNAPPDPTKEAKRVRAFAAARAGKRRLPKMSRARSV